VNRNEKNLLTVRHSHASFFTAAGIPLQTSHESQITTALIFLRLCQVLDTCASVKLVSPLATEKHVHAQFTAHLGIPFIGGFSDHPKSSVSYITSEQQNTRRLESAISNEGDYSKDGIIKE
jgi:hypothetical protein